MNHEAIYRQRWALLQHLNALTDKPMILLAFVWLGLLILDFTRGLSPLLQLLSYGIWGLFILDFVIELLIAPHKGAYLCHHPAGALCLCDVRLHHSHDRQSFCGQRDRS